jgi:uncharacterized membrane protein
MRNAHGRGPAVLSWLHQVALSLWLGGIVIIGAVVAPATFGSARAQGQTDSSQPLFAFAGQVLGEVFRRFNYVVLVAGTLMLVAGVRYASLSGFCRKRITVRAALTAVALGIAAWLSAAVYPEMFAARARGDMATFEPLHKASTTAFQAQMVLLLGVAALTAWMHPGERGGPLKQDGGP